MKKNMLAIALLILGMQFANAQITFSGKVISGKDKENVEFAEITLVNDNQFYGFVSDENGEFTVHDFVPGTYQVTIYYIGYTKYQETLELTNFKKPMVFKLQKINVFLDAAIIESVRANPSTPNTSTYLDKKDIETQDQGKDFPFIINTTPSTVISSDAGNGVGYTGIRIRGIDPTRVNITINGIPLNDAESQGVYWVNLPDLSSSTENVQIQRGVGTSTNGSSAFGASISIRTNDLDSATSNLLTLGSGSFNTNRLSFIHNSGRKKSNWGYQFRGSIIESDGFIDRASSELKSFNGIVGKYWENSSLKLNVLLGSERTYQAWWGIPEPKFFGNMSDLTRYQNELWITGSDLENLTNSNSKTYNYYTYENEVDRYNQNHYQLFYDAKLDTNWNLSTAFYATTGAGYYEQYKPGESLSDYGISPYIIGQDTNTSADVVRRRWLKNTLLGAIASVRYHNKNKDFILGTGFNQYNGRHYGEAIATEFTGYEDLHAIYYDNDAVKTDGNVYAKLSLKKGFWHPYIDLQYRMVQYQFEGFNNQQALSIHTVNYGFFNPKFGVTYNRQRYSFYAIYARGNREPVRDDFRNNTPATWPKHEQLDNVEMGYKYAKKRSQFGITLYYMQYKDQLVLTGAVNDVGEAVRTNVDNSFRRGIETEFQFALSKDLQFGGNLTLSQNTISSFTETVYAWDSESETLTNSYKNTAISFSPNVISMANLVYRVNKHISVSGIGKYVGKQYLDNTENENRKLDGFTNVDFAVRYTNTVKGLKKYEWSFFVNNVLNAYYVPNGYTYSGVIRKNRQDFNYLYPMAGRNFMVKFQASF